MSRPAIRIALALTLSIVFISYIFAPVVIADTEPNDDLDTADSIESGDTVMGALDSEYDYYDYYEIELSEKEELTVIMTSSVGDFDLYLLDSDWNELASSYNDYSNEEIFYIVTGDDSYYIECSAWEGSGQYTLEVDVWSPGLLDQQWFWMLLIIVIIVMVVIMVAAKVASKPKEGDEMFGATPVAQPPPPVQMPTEQQPQDELNAEQVHCENCQKLIPADSAICPYCGTNPFERTY